MREFEALAHQAEDDGVLARVIARPQGMHADLPPGPLANQAVPPVGQPVRPDRLRGNLGQPERRAARGVLLELVVPLDHLDIGRVAQRLRRLADELEQQVDRPARVRRDQQGDPIGEALQARLLVGREPRRPNDEGNPPLGAGGGERQGRSRAREVDHYVDRLRDAGFERDAQRAEADEGTDVRPDPGMTRAVDRRAERQVGVGLDQLDQPGPHPASGAVDADGERFRGQSESPSSDRGATPAARPDPIGSA